MGNLLGLEVEITTDTLLLTLVTKSHDPLRLDRRCDLDFRVLFGLTVGVEGFGDSQRAKSPKREPKDLATGSVNWQEDRLQRHAPLRLSVFVNDRYQSQTSPT